MNLATNMVDAWRERAERARVRMVQIGKAPGLFKPEAALEAIREFERCAAEVRRWSA